MKIMAPLTVEEVAALKVGDTFYTEGLFCGLSDKRLKWTVLSTKKEAKAVAAVLRASYFGIDLGEFVLSHMNRKMSLYGKAPSTV